MNTQHTPGPWKKYTGQMGGRCIKHENIFICQYGHVDSKESGKAEADGRLIAAAPDLLDALEHTVSAWSEQFERQGHNGPTWVIKARAAIAKATSAA